MKAKRIKPTRKKTPSVPLGVRLERLFFSTKEKQAFLEDLATLIEDGVPARRALEVIYKLSSGAMKRLCQSMLDQISKGRGLAEGMQGWLPHHIVELVKAGEQGGTLSNNMRVAAETLGRKNEALSSLATSLTYPMVVVLAALIVLVYLNHSVFMRFADIKPINQWPENGQQLVALATFIQHWGWLSLFVIVATILFFRKMFRDYVGGVRQIIDSIPLLNIYRQAVAARFMETLGLLISNGIVFKQALGIIQSQATPYMLWHLRRMERRLGRGRANIAEVLDTKLIDEGDILRLKAIADAKGFEHALVRLGKQSAQKGLEKITKLGKFTGGVLLALGALLAAMMVMGMYSVGSSLG